MLLRALCVLNVAGAIAVGMLSAATAADDGPRYGPQLEGFEYPWPVSRFSFASQGETLEIAYMDVKAAAPNGRVAVLLHGKNFCAATWQDTIAVLSAAGYRVIAPDQIGFCKSSKPAHYQFSFQQLAGNTRALLASLGISRVTMIGHSTGGMLGIRYALMYPDEVDQLVLVDPIGLEDWKARACRGRASMLGTGKTSRRPPAAFAIMSARLITPGPGIRNMSAGCRCWPACTAVRAATSSPGIPRCSTT